MSRYYSAQAQLDTDRFFIAIISSACDSRSVFRAAVNNYPDLWRASTISLCLYALSGYVLYMYVNRQIENEQILSENVLIYWTLGKTMFGLINSSHIQQASPFLVCCMIISPEFTCHSLGFHPAYCRLICLSFHLCRSWVTLKISSLVAAERLIVDFWV